MVTTLEIVKAFINSHYGWAVADQFEDTFLGQSFEKQNYNALRYIHGAVLELIEDSDVLSDSAIDELQSYSDDLGIYLAKNN
jgi:hypothetical protein